MRIFDELLAQPGSQFKAAVADTEVFNIDNVAEYFYAQTDQEFWDVKTDFPCLAPPFPNFWMEFTRPSRIVSRVTGVHDNQGLPHRVGLWFVSSEHEALVEKWRTNEERTEALKAMEELQKVMEEDFTPEIDRELRIHFQDNPCPLDPTDKRWESLSVPGRLALSRLMQWEGFRLALNPEKLNNSAQEFAKNGTRWWCCCATFVQLQRNGEVIGPLGQHTLQLTAEGQVQLAQETFDMRFITKEGWNTEGAGISTLWFPALLAISFCHCKNVTIHREETATALQKRQRQRGGPRTVFKVLEIEPMKKVLEKATLENSTGLKRALHICRGHFANYEAHPLFGKYRGRFWIPQHLRGTVDIGIVHKEYSVKPSDKS